MGFEGVHRLATKIETESSGAKISVPVSDDSIVGDLIAENVQDSSQGLVVSNVEFDTYRYSSKIALVSAELVQDFHPTIQAYLGGLLARRMGPGNLFGSPIALNPAMANMESGAKPILFGDFSAYGVRAMPDVHVHVYREKFIDYDQV